MEACIERVTHELVAGWAVDRSYEKERLLIELHVEGQKVAETWADKFRGDLKQNNVGDGCYGYVFDELNIANLPSIYLSGRLSVVAIGKSASQVASPAGYLRSHVEYLVRVQPLETMTLSEFLLSLPATDRLAADEASNLLEMINASRAHFPDWRRSIDFVATAAQLAKRCSKPWSVRFYEAMLSALQSDTGTNSPEFRGPPLERIQREETYGTLHEWMNSPDIGIKLLCPRWFSAWNPPSFLEEAAILAPVQSNGRQVPILALREFAFSEPTWWVKRQGVATRVSRTLYYVDFETLRAALDEGGMLLIDMSNEGCDPEISWLYVLNAALRDLAIDPWQVILVTQNLKFAAAANSEGFPCHVTSAHFFISKSLEVLGKQFPTDSSLAAHCRSIIRQRAGTPSELLKHYICLNFTPRWSRWATALYLSFSGFLDRGFVSFPGARNFKQPSELDLASVMPDIEHKSALLGHVPEFLSKCPLRLDVDAGAASSPDFIYPIEQMTKSLLHIVTESEMSDGTRQQRVTEKILKPIIGLQPFVVVGNPGSLQIMRAMGFRTFPTLLDERYDAIEDPAQRFNALFAEMEKLLRKDVNALRRTVESLNDTLIFNFLHLMTIGPRLFNDAVRNRVAALIAANSPMLSTGAPNPQAKFD